MIKRGPISYVVDGVEYKMTEEEVEQYLALYLKEYLSSIENLTAKEKADAVKWFNAGNDIMDNPWYLYTEFGYPMDYISAKRFNDTINICDCS